MCFACALLCVPSRSLLLLVACARVLSLGRASCFVLVLVGSRCVFFDVVVVSLLRTRLVVFSV